MNTALSVVDYIKKLHETPPKVSLSMHCYHMETYTTTSTDSNGNMTVNTITVPVVTYRETEAVNVVSWQDISTPLSSKDIHEYQLTKLKLKQTCTGDDNLTQQRNRLIGRNRHRDALYNSYVDLEIDGFKTHVLSFVDLDKRPPCVSGGWFWVANLTFFPSLPYRIWISAITGKIDHEVHKAIQTTGSPP